MRIRRKSGRKSVRLVTILAVAGVLVIAAAALAITLATRSTSVAQGPNVSQGRIELALDLFVPDRADAARRPLVEHQPLVELESVADLMPQLNSGSAVPGNPGGVPEPATMATLLAGSLLLFYRRRARKA